MNNTEYQDILGISSHWLIAMLQSPAACWRKYLDPQRPAEEPTDALRLGTLVHCLALTPRQLRAGVYRCGLRAPQPGRTAGLRRTGRNRFDRHPPRRAGQGPRPRRRPARRSRRPQVAAGRQEGADDHPAQGERLASAQGPAGRSPGNAAASGGTENDVDSIAAVETAMDTLSLSTVRRVLSGLGARSAERDLRVRADPRTLRGAGDADGRRRSFRTGANNGKPPWRCSISVGGERVAGSRTRRPGR